MRKIQNGESFNESFKNTMGSGIKEKWVQFVLQLKERIDSNTQKIWRKNKAMLNNSEENIE